MSSSWQLPQALGQSWGGAGVHSHLVNRPLQVYTELSLLRVRLWARDGSHDPHYLPGAPQSSRAHRIVCKGCFLCLPAN